MISLFKYCNFLVNKVVGLESIYGHWNYTKLSIFHCLSYFFSKSNDNKYGCFFFFNPRIYKFPKHKGHRVSLRYFLLMLSAKMVSERKLLTLSKYLTWPMIATYFYMMLWDVLEKGLFRLWETVAVFPEGGKKGKVITELSFLTNRTWE